MTMGRLNILILEDNPADSELMKRELRKSGLDFAARVTQSRAEFVAALDAFTPGLLLTDYSLPDFSAIGALTLARERFPELPVIVVSGAIGEETAIETLKAGATDYVLKQRLARLGPVVHRALEEARLLGEKKRAEDELRRSNESLEQFAHVAAHDLREPLRVIAGFSELLGRKYKGRLDKNADEYIYFITDGAQRMQKLVDDLLAYARAGRGDAASGRVDCGAVLGRVLEGMQLAVKESGAEITCGELPVLAGSETDLLQLFQNLIGNAIKFHGAEPPRVRVGAERRGGDWLFSVSDNGIGLAPHDQERVFQMFQRLHSGAQYPGTGIGLAICKKIVDQLGGRIWVESEPGRGAAFYFTLPAAQKEK